MRSSSRRDLSTARDELLADYRPTVVALTRQLRTVLLALMPEASERVYRGWRGIGFHHPTGGYVCALFPGDVSVRVGFEQGYLLTDPDQLLEGTGSQVRYLTVTEWEPGLVAVLERLLHQAIHLR